MPRLVPSLAMTEYSISLGMTVEELLLAIVGGRLFAIGGEFLELAHAVTVLRGGDEVE